MKSHYSMKIQWSEEDACYIASLPEFGPYVKTHGATYEEAARNGREVLEMMLSDEDESLPQPEIYRESRARA
ncbi:MAG: type II toxin-antitoxin system HicB family antitoxin [Gammaproteobacteria bacterium]|nr:type II toxin-antitoxin system HicB family antitoxin [Gammaproteobacteria bacterium]MDA8002737.1 type II toxin-antitoxin system HicB family antitoxin [Alphaproteobacteria bacterium]CAJ2376414.1 MAG: HicB-like domain-containing protein [Arenicellales bacterium IbO2]MDA7960963.1 type II toxin-antitoxin system HicB family antitoxin [Gammaproteobacteria bacterium]MDA7968629.1 type II toxin-antitoxin system HicB family antitoxin [Gammaproteobacteria bacterium]